MKKNQQLRNQMAQLLAGYSAAEGIEALCICLVFAAVKLDMTPDEYETLFRMAWTAWAPAARELLARKN